MGDESIRVNADLLGQFAASVGLDSDGGTGMSQDFLGSALGIQGDLMLNTVMASFQGGGLEEGKAFAQAHAQVVNSLVGLLMDAGMGLAALAQGAESVRGEYLAGDADASAVTEAVYRTFIPAMEKAAERDHEVRQAVRDEFLLDAINRGTVGEAMIVLSGGQADLAHARDLQRDAAENENEDDALKAKLLPEFDADVAEKVEQIEDGRAPQSDATGVGDLGRGTPLLEILGTPIMNSDGEVIEWIPHDDERVADNPPMMFEPLPPTPGV